MQCSTELTPGHSLSVSCYCTPCTNTNQHFHSRAQSLAEYELCWIATLLELQNTKYWFDFQRWEIILWRCGGGGCWLWHWWSWFSVSTPLQGRIVTQHVKLRKREKSVEAPPVLIIIPSGVLEFLSVELAVGSGIWFFHQEQVTTDHDL